MSKTNFFRIGATIVAVGIFTLCGILLYKYIKADPLLQEQSIEQQIEEMEPQQMPDSISAVLETLSWASTSNLPVFICRYRIEATEKMPQVVKFGNFQADTIYDRYHQDHPFETILPGKAPERIIDLLKVVPAQEQGAEVVAIRSFERIPGTCKLYYFEPEEPQEEVDPKN